jgi:hypothetical protein
MGICDSWVTRIMLWTDAKDTKSVGASQVKYSLVAHAKASLPLETVLLIGRPGVLRSFPDSLKSLSFSVVCARRLYMLLAVIHVDGLWGGLIRCCRARPKRCRIFHLRRVGIDLDSDLCTNISCQSHIWYALRRCDAEAVPRRLRRRGLDLPARR